MTSVVAKVLTLEKAAEALGLTTTQLRWLRAQGSGPKGARIGRRVYYRESDLAEWVDQKFNSESEDERDLSP